ncbi:MAG: ATP-binding cassette domain-containing protein, partial [Lentisphaerae bacterium]
SFLKFAAAIRLLEKPKEAVERVIEACALQKVVFQSIGTLSKGYRRRVGLAQALVHDPDVLILDEPTDGLDPNQKYQVRELIKKLASSKCIIVSTHILEEVDAICNRMIIIANGRKIVDTTPEEIRKREQGTLDEIFRRLTLEQVKQTA